MLTIASKCRRNQKLRYGFDSRGVKHRLIDRFVFDGREIVFSNFYHNRPWLLKNLVKEIASFVEKAFSEKENYRVCHLVAYGKSQEDLLKIYERWEKLFDYSLASSNFGGKRNGKVHFLISFNVSDNGKFHCHLFFLLPKNIFLGPSKFVSYFSSNGISCHPAVNSETGKQGNEVLGKIETFVWLLYLAKFEGQDNFPKGFKTLRLRSGNLKKSFVEAKEVPSSVSPCVPNIDQEFCGVKVVENRKNTSETQEDLNIEEILEDLKNAELHQNSEGRRRLEKSEIDRKKRLSRNRRKIREVLETCQSHLFFNLEETQEQPFG